jgi:hypothetical protein
MVMLIGIQRSSEKHRLSPLLCKSLGSTPTAMWTDATGWKNRGLTAKLLKIPLYRTHRHSISIPKTWIVIYTNTSTYHQDVFLKFCPSTKRGCTNRLPGAWPHGKPNYVRPQSCPCPRQKVAEQSNSRPGCIFNKAQRHNSGLGRFTLEVSISLHNQTHANTHHGLP